MHMVQITRRSGEWHDRFFTHVAGVFPGIDFRAWTEAGCWTNRYDVLALVSGEAIISTIGRTRMVLSIADTPGAAEFRTLREGLQLGAVATRPDMRGKGHASLLLRRCLAEADRAGTPVLLFSSEAARRFYPRFGFVAVPATRFEAFDAYQPAGHGAARRLDPHDPEDRQLLALLVSGAASHRGGLSARTDLSILLWYLMNTPVSAQLLADGSAAVFVEEEEGRLHIREWLGRRPPDYRPLVPGLLGNPVSSISFGFVPPRSWIGPHIRSETDTEERLFLRGMAIPPPPVCFPHLLRT